LTDYYVLAIHYVQTANSLPKTPTLLPEGPELQLTNSRFAWAQEQIPGCKL